MKFPLALSPLGRARGLNVSMGKFKNVGIVGLGLIGASLALEIKKRNIAVSVTGFSRRLSTLKKSKEQGLIDKYFVDFEDGLKDLNLLMIATPISVMKNYFVKIKKYNPALFVMDVASVKEGVIKDAYAVLGKDSNFVGCHPIAGSEKSGIEAVKENLFDGRVVIITPSEHTKKENILKVKRFWKLLGSIPVVMSPSEHDRFLALTSHLPHLLVYALISLITGFEGKRKVLSSCIGTGFLDTTRIGKSSPELWAEILIANRDNLLPWILEFEQILSGMKGMLERGSCEELTKKLISLKKAREGLDEKRRDIQKI
jgi:prephenate dehydrogenase